MTLSRPGEESSPGMSTPRERESVPSPTAEGAGDGASEAVTLPLDQCLEALVCGGLEGIATSLHAALAFAHLIRESTGAWHPASQRLTGLESCAVNALEQVQSLSSVLAGGNVPARVELSRLVRNAHLLALKRQPGAWSLVGDGTLGSTLWINCPPVFAVGAIASALGELIAATAGGGSIQAQLLRSILGTHHGLQLSVARHAGGRSGHRGWGSREAQAEWWIEKCGGALEWLDDAVTLRRILWFPADLVPAGASPEKDGVGGTLVGLVGDLKSSITELFVGGSRNRSLDPGS